MSLYVCVCVCSFASCSGISAIVTLPMVETSWFGRLAARAWSYACACLPSESHQSSRARECLLASFESMRPPRARRESRVCEMPWVTWMTWMARHDAHFSQSHIGISGRQVDQRIPPPRRRERASQASAAQGAGEADACRAEKQEAVSCAFGARGMGGGVELLT